MQTSKVVTMLAGVLALSGAAHAGEVAAVAPVAGGADFLAKGKDTVSVRFAGRTEFQWEDNDNDNEGFEFRRLRFGAKAKLASGWSAELITDFDNNANSGGSADIRKAIVSKKLSEYVTMQLGSDKVVFGHEETSSSSKGVFLERSRLNNRLKGGLGLGVNENVTFKADLGGGFKAAASIADSQTANADAAYYARLTWSNDNLLVGADFADNNDNDGFTAYVSYSTDNFNITGEYFDAEVGGTDVDGFSVRASYRFGNWEPVVRFSDYDFGASEDDETFVGVNYYIAPQVTLLAGYGETEEGGVDGESTTVRLRVLW